MSIGRVQNEKRDAALVQLYELLSKRSEPAPGTFSALDAEGKRSYFTEKRRSSRAKAKAETIAGNHPATSANIRGALADAALLILATGGPGSDQIRHVLASIFASRPGVPIDVENRARRGRLRPKLISLPTGETASTTKSPIRRDRPRFRIASPALRRQRS